MTTDAVDADSALEDCRWCVLGFPDTEVMSAMSTEEIGRIWVSSRMLGPFQVFYRAKPSFCW